MMNKPLNGKVAVVTGAGSGMGREIALSLAQDGARVILCGRRAEPLELIKTKIVAAGGTAYVEPLDITDRSAVFDFVTRAKKFIGPIDLLVNNAGSASKVLNARWLSEEEFVSTVDVNLTAVFNFSQAVLPDMLAKGEGTHAQSARWGRLWGRKSRCAQLYGIYARHVPSSRHSLCVRFAGRSRHANPRQSCPSAERDRARTDAGTRRRGRCRVYGGVSSGPCDRARAAHLSHVPA
jgi:NAD(P)-dependent dehydrogenase (short-subunit alcohol dehydrogenase family)